VKSKEKIFQEGKNYRKEKSQTLFVVLLFFFTKKTPKLQDLH